MRVAPPPPPHRVTGSGSEEDAQMKMLSLLKPSSILRLAVLNASDGHVSLVHGSRATDVCA